MRIKLKRKIGCMHQSLRLCAKDVGIEKLVLTEIITGTKKPTIKELQRLALHLCLTEEEVLYND